MFEFFTPWKTTEHSTYDFMTFSVDRKLKYCLKMSSCAVFHMFLFSAYTIYTFSNFRLSKIYTHHVLIYLDVPEIPVKEPLQNR